MTEELFEHLKKVEPGRTSLPIYFFRRTLGDEKVTALKIPQKRTSHAGSAGNYARESDDPAGNHADGGRKHTPEREIEK